MVAATISPRARSARPRSRSRAGSAAAGGAESLVVAGGEGLADGPWGPRAGDAVPGALWSRGGVATHSRHAREGGGARVLLHPRLGRLALPGGRARHREGRPRGRLPR